MQYNACSAVLGAIHNPFGQYEHKQPVRVHMHYSHIPVHSMARRMRKLRQHTHNQGKQASWRYLVPTVHSTLPYNVRFLQVAHREQVLHIQQLLGDGAAYCGIEHTAGVAVS